MGSNVDDQEINILAQELISKYTSSEFDEKYALFLLDILEYDSDESMFIVLDNIDKTYEKEQEEILKLTSRLLKNANIKLIVPLRKSSQLLGDRFKGLSETRFDGMELSPLNFKEMIHKRFRYNSEGKNIYNKEIIENGNKYTYKIIYNLLFVEDDPDSAGNLLIQLSYPNARVFLSMVMKVITSSQLKGLENINKNEFVIAALMLSDESTGDPYDTFLLNLFENNEPGVYGNNLIRFRLLEYFYQEKNGSPNDSNFEKHFQRLNYNMDKLIKVLSIFVGRNLLQSSKFLSPDEILNKSIDELGSYNITKSGEAYFDLLLKKQWYFVAIMRNTMFHSSYISYDKERKHEYILHRNFKKFFEDSEIKEQEFRDQSVKKMGKSTFQYIYPSQLAQTALFQYKQLDHSHDNNNGD